MKIIRIIIIAMLFFVNDSKSQDRMGPIQHAYATDQAWQLALHFDPNKSNSEMHRHMSNIQDGVILEDFNNIVYPYSTECDLAHTSTHFWEADDGDDHKFRVLLCGTGIHCEFHNSYQKILRYWNGGDTWNNGATFKILKSPFRPAIGGGTTGAWNIWLTYSSLPNAYKNHELMVSKMLHIGSGNYVYFNPPQPYYKLFIDHNIGKINSRNFCWNIVGRIVHLLEDNSVPAHVHDDPHPNEQPPCADDPDSYEWNYLSEHYMEKNWQSALYECVPLSGGPINLSGKTNPLRYLLFLTNQVADRFPSNDIDGDRGFADNSDNYGQLLTPFYNEMDNQVITYASFGNNTPPSNLMPAILKYSFVFNFRVVAGFLCYVYNQFEIIPDPPVPVITNITANMIGDPTAGFTLFKGQTGALYSTVQGSPVNYTWTLYECNPNLWQYWPYNDKGIVTQSYQNSSHFALWNQNYAGQFCAVRDNVPSSLHFYTKLRAYNNSGEDWSDLFRINPTTNLSGGGCPYIFVLGNDTSGGKYFTENNILHHSEFTENANQSITDVYKLKTVPKIDSNKITIQIMETENDVNYFDQIKLFAVDHPVGSKIGITESNDIVMYYPDDVSSSDLATKNFSINNIAPYIQYGQPSPKITGSSNDFVNAYYDSTSQNSKLKSYINRLKAKGYKNISDSLALIGEVGSDGFVVENNSTAKDWAGSISIYTNSDTYTKPFSKRVNVSDVIIPFSQTNDNVDHIDINFNSDYAMSYFSVVPVSYEGFTKTELSLISAVHAVNGDILSSLSSIDYDFVIMDTTAIIDLKFGSINPPDPSMVRDYVFVVNGKYTSDISSDNSQLLRTTSNNNLKPENIAYKYKLNVNYPNPFNPKTKISYSLEKAGNTKLMVYDILGRLVNVIVNEYKSAGEYTVEFNGSHLSSGVYIYRLESNDFIDTKRMVLIK